MKYYIGIDGGGTKSRLLAIDQAAQRIDLIHGESTNLASNTKEFVGRVLRDMFSVLFTQNDLNPESCLGLCIGSAGLDHEGNCEQMEGIIRESGFTCPVLAVNDSLPVLAAATGGEPGVVLISGTGSIAFGIDPKGNTTRAGGWGHVFADGGSGYWIGKEALKHAFLSYDRRVGETFLEDGIKKHFKIGDLTQCMDIIYGEDAIGKAEIAGLALLVAEGARQNDRTCLQILHDAAKELFILVDTTLRNTDAEKLDVTVSGGNIMGNEVLFDMLQQMVNEAYPDVCVQKIDKEPVCGAAYLAMGVYSRV